MLFILWIWKLVKYLFIPFPNKHFAKRWLKYQKIVITFILQDNMIWRGEVAGNSTENLI